MTDRSPVERRVLAFLVSLILLGVVGVAASIVNGLAQRDTAAAEARQNRVLLEQLRAVEDAQSQDVTEHRVRNEELHADLCRIVFEVATAAKITVQPCSPALVPEQGSVSHSHPTPGPTPSPTPSGG